MATAAISVVIVMRKAPPSNPVPAHNVCAILADKVKSTRTITSPNTVTPNIVLVASPLALSSLTTAIAEAGERAVVSNEVYIGFQRSVFSRDTMWTLLPRKIVGLIESCYLIYFFNSLLSIVNSKNLPVIIEAATRETPAIQPLFIEAAHATILGFPAKP
jgi:hypothetical protein